MRRDLVALLMRFRRFWRQVGRRWGVYWSRRRECSLLVGGGFGVLVVSGLVEIGDFCVLRF